MSQVIPLVLGMGYYLVKLLAKVVPKTLPQNVQAIGCPSLTDSDVLLLKIPLTDATDYEGWSWGPTRSFTPASSTHGARRYFECRKIIVIDFTQLHALLTIRMTVQ